MKEVLQFPPIIKLRQFVTDISCDKQEQISWYIETLSTMYALVTYEIMLRPCSEVSYLRAIRRLYDVPFKDQRPFYQKEEQDQEHFTVC